MKPLFVVLVAIGILGRIAAVANTLLSAGLLGLTEFRLRRKRA